jgi:hypothetical protein
MNRPPSAWLWSAAARGRVPTSGAFPSAARAVRFKGPERVRCLVLTFLLWSAGPLGVLASPIHLDVAPFGRPLPGLIGLEWEDPREIHQVTVAFKEAAPRPDRVKLEYWGSRWPQQHLPKDRAPGGGEVGWMELGNWYQYGWRTADAVVTAGPEPNAVSFTFRPVNSGEFPEVKNYPAPFRYTLKVRVVVPDQDPPPPVERIQVFTDSIQSARSVRLVWEVGRTDPLTLEAFNGTVERSESPSPWEDRVRLHVAVNSDPNTFDRTLVTVQGGREPFTFAVDDLADGPLYLPHLGVAVLPEEDGRDYADIAAAQRTGGTRTLYDRVADLPEQTWRKAWSGMPPKRSRIYFPMGWDGGRQRFRLNADGSLDFRSNDSYLRSRPGRDTPRLSLERGPVRIRFGLPGQPVDRSLDEDSLPVCRTTWEIGGIRIQETAFVTLLSGTQAEGPVPEPDATAVFFARFAFTNSSGEARTMALPFDYRAGRSGPLPLRRDQAGLLWTGSNVRGQWLKETQPEPGVESELKTGLEWNPPSWTLKPGATGSMLLKVPYLVLTEKKEQEALAGLDFDGEHEAVAGYWRRRLDEGARLITPEPMLDQFYRAQAGHLLVNCEREPGSDRRFARVGSFSYGAYGNESCMMVVDLDRRGYHREARECLEGWLHYQGTVGLPGDFASKDGVLYGAGGYEAGGYNQHHGWILWMLAEHYRFTRDVDWLRPAAPGLVAGADWILRETERTAGRTDLSRGLLPAGRLEDIGDWWTWLSTSCYTWRGLDAAAWALEQIRHPAAPRLRRGADLYHARLLENFGRAAARAPVVRLRDGTAVPHFPSHVQRRGRCFGWICETLEGAMHLLISGALDPNSREAEWILKDYEDNLYLSHQYGYELNNFNRDWFGRGGMSMQACLLLDVEPYLYRDDVKQALRALFNALAVSHFPDVHINTEHALPDMGDWRGDHFKTSDESNACGWLRSLFVRESGDELLIGQAVPRTWLEAGRECGLERAATYFGPVSVRYSGLPNEIVARLQGPRRNPPASLRVRFREPAGRPLASVTVNKRPWGDYQGDWVRLPGSVGTAVIRAKFTQP